MAPGRTRAPLPAGLCDVKGVEVSASILDPVQPTLSPFIWEHPEAPEPFLKPKVANYIRRTIYGVLERHGYSDPHEWLRLVLTGSLTTYQYADDSDCDISLFVDSAVFPEWSRGEMIGIMISEVDGGQAIIPGTPYPLQCFVVARKFQPTDLYKPGLRSGYDIDHGRWIVAPDKQRSHDVQAQEYGAYAYGLQMADKMERLLRYEPDKAEQFWHQIHTRRMRDQTAGKGDYSDSNIVYKFLAKRGLLPEIAQLTGEHIAAAPVVRHNLQWQPGGPGKGFILQDGSVYTWPTQNMRPQHDAVETRARMDGAAPVKRGTEFHIEPHGRVWQFNRQGDRPGDLGWRSFDPDDRFNIMKSNAGLWFGQPGDMQPPNVVDNGYGHATELMPAPVTAAAPDKMAMAERTGNPELDAAIAQFMMQHHDELGDIQDFRHPMVAWGRCEEVARACADFLKQRGFRAQAEADELGAFGYHDAQPTESVMTPEGPAGDFTYPEHAVVTIYNENGIAWWQIDFTAAQYGYKEFPKVEPGPPGPLIGPQRETFSGVSDDTQAMLDANAGTDLQGLPGRVNVPGYGPLQFHGNADIQRVANEYNAANGLGAHPTDYVPVNPQNAQRIAAEYERMQHAPNHPAVAQAYQALANESMAQYQHAVNNGYQFEFYPEDHDPYPNSPREAVMDLHRNKHMYVYPTEAGFGSGGDTTGHPLMADSGERWGGKPVTYNDIFRAIHDFYGHGKEGLGFRAHGEDNAYRQHAAMFSPAARQALASETRGQNSWVNFGPHGQTNQTANQAETVYAPQKAGLLPEWVSDPSLHQQSTFARTAASDVANTAYQATVSNGGITVGLDGSQPSSGFAYSPAKSEESIIPLEQLTPDDFDHYIVDHYGLLNQPGYYLGAWVDGPYVYLDLSVVNEDRAQAFQGAQGANQHAMYDLGTFEEIPVLRAA